MALYRSRLRGHNLKLRMSWSSKKFMLLVVLPLLGSGSTTAAAAKQTSTRIQGRLMYRTAHVADIWKLVTSSGDAFKLPGQPHDSIGDPISPGSFVALDCTSKAEDSASCVRVANAAITRAAAPVRSLDVELRLLVMVISLQGTCTRAGVPVEAVQRAYTSELGYANYLKNCSYGKVTYDPSEDGVTVISTPVSCNAGILQCDEDAIAAGARLSAIKTHGATFVASFTRFTYVLPIDLEACGWVGLADLPGANSWYAANSEGIFNKGTVLQETLHNFGIYHGWKDGVEYADNSTAMGSGLACPSAPELWRLGWASVAELLNSDSLPPKVFKSHTLPATCEGPSKVMLKIKPDWLGAAYTRNVYLALRANGSGDRDLDQPYNRKISVHQLEKTIDNSFWGSGDPKVTILRTIDPYSSADLSAFKLLVKTGALSADGMRMSVHVCRYLAALSECVLPLDTPNGNSSNSNSNNNSSSNDNTDNTGVSDSAPDASNTASTVRAGDYETYANDYEPIPPPPPSPPPPPPSKAVRSPSPPRPSPPPPRPPSPPRSPPRPPTSPKRPAPPPSPNPPSPKPPRRRPPPSLTLG